MKQSILGISLALLAAFVFYFSTKTSQAHGDYTFRIARALLHGELGLRQGEFPGYLSELIPYEGKYYSAFPLGSVISMIPVALVFPERAPVSVITAVIAGGCVYFFFGLGQLFDLELSRRIMLAFFPVFATLTWANLGIGGAWFIALGLALLGEAGALYFTLVRPLPLVAGTFFAVAFGNRTELVVTAPIFLGFLWAQSNTSINSPVLRVMWYEFLSLPVVLGVLTAAYNFARFHSVLDFGYLHIPGLAPLFDHGFYSFHAIAMNAQVMLVDGYGIKPVFPFLSFPVLGCSMFSTSPFLFLIFRGGGKLRQVCWVVLGLLTLSLWCHGGAPGGYQFAYRYGMILLPWMFLLIAGNGPRGLTPIESVLFVVSVSINAVATRFF